jgi:hypothetical protein
MSIRGLQKSAAPATCALQVILRVMRWETYTRSVLMRTTRNIYIHLFVYIMVHGLPTFFSSSFPFPPSFYIYISCRCLHSSSFAPSKSLLTRHKQEIRPLSKERWDFECLRPDPDTYNIVSRPPHPFVGFSRVFLTRTAPAPPRSTVSAGSRRDRGKPEDGEKIYYYYDNIKPALIPFRTLVYI